MYCFHPLKVIDIILHNTNTMRSNDEITPDVVNGTTLTIYTRLSDGAKMVDVKHTYVYCKTRVVKFKKGSLLRGGSKSAKSHLDTLLRKGIIGESDFCYRKNGIITSSYTRGARALIRLTKVMPDLTTIADSTSSSSSSSSSSASSSSSSSSSSSASSSSSSSSPSSSSSSSSPPPTTTTTTHPIHQDSLPNAAVVAATHLGKAGALGNNNNNNNNNNNAPERASTPPSFRKSMKKSYAVRPPKLDRLPTDKLYGTDKGGKCPLTLYGTIREINKVYLDCIQIGSVFHLTGLSHRFKSHWPDLIEGTHFVWFMISVRCSRFSDRLAVTESRRLPQNTMPTRKKSHERVVKRRYLTWAGFVQIAMRSRSPEAKKFREFAEETIFVCSNGTSSQRMRLGAKVTGIPLRELERTLSFGSSELSAIYLHRIKTVDEARRDGIKGKPIVFKTQVPGGHIIAKIGQTEHMQRRCGEHRRDHKAAANLQCLMYAQVNSDKLKEAENYVLDVFGDCNLKQLATTDLNEYFVLDPKMLRMKHNQAKSTFRAVKDRFNVGGVPPCFNNQMRKIEIELAVSRERVRSQTDMNSLLREQLSDVKAREVRQYIVLDYIMSEKI